MRPHKLTMKAFGPFAKETVVDFDAMGDSIYLICGDTGSGKTTIFDGIIYALFGTASGGARSGLGTEAFHSDYAKDGLHHEEMRVELEFSHAGNDFTVERKISWGKTGNSKTAQKESVLYQNGRTIASDTHSEDRDDVTKKVTEIIGLDANQFRRIIMLAQGEFQRFLSAKSDERGIILGKLYDNRRHKDLQYRLKAAAALLKGKDKDLGEQAKINLNLLNTQGNLADEEKAALTVDHPDLLSVLDRFLERYREVHAAAKESAQEKEDSLKSLNEEKTKGEMCNKLLDALESKKALAAELKKGEEEINTLKTRVGLAEAAEKVLPFEDAMLKADEEWKNAQKKIEQLTKASTKLSERAQALQEKAETEVENSDQIKELEGKKAAIQRNLSLYDTLAQSVKIQKATAKAKKAADEEVKKAEGEKSENEKRRRELKDELARLESAGETAVTLAKNNLDSLIKRKEALKGIRQTIEDVKVLINDERSLKNELSDARQTELTAEEDHHRLYQAFIRGQAGILAQAMREKLKEETKVRCPVCGTLHTEADSHAFAILEEDIPDKITVDEAYKAWDNARTATKNAETKHSQKKQERLLKENDLETAAKESLSVSQWDDLEDGTVLSTATESCEKQIDEARTAYAQAVKDREAKETAQSEHALAEGQIAALEATLSDARRKQNEAHEAATAAETQMSSWQAQLEGFPESKDAAQGEIDTLNAQISEMQTAIKRANRALSAIRQGQAKNEGKLNEARSDREKREKVKESAAEDFADQLEKQEFKDKEAYHRALSPDGLLLERDALATWITKGKECIDGYEQNIRDLDAAIEQLTESTKEMQRADIAAIQAQIDCVENELEQLRSKVTDLEGKIKNDEKVRDQLISILNLRRKYRKALERLGPLADTADGKYAFSTYALAGFFHRIVERANIRLKAMTDGEYRLVPSETGDGRSNIGLGLKVLNTFANRVRETASLSGGQLFEASLSLALGLSDIVQMESASSMHIDSMFIDEGFGSLDATRLEKAIEVLQQLSEGERQVGIISHVARLDECLSRKIHVIAGERGSSVQMESDV